MGSLLNYMSSTDLSNFVHLQRIHELEALCNDMPFMQSVLSTGEELQVSLVSAIN